MRMKKLVYFVLAIATLGVMASCGGAGSDGPGKAAKQYAEYMAAGNYDKMLDGLYTEPDADPKEVEQGKAMLKSMLEEKGKESIEENGGIKSVEVVSEEIAEDGQSAKVKLLYTYGNGETEENNMPMRLDGNKWKWEMEK